MKSRITTRAPRPAWLIVLATAALVVGTAGALRAAGVDHDLVVPVAGVIAGAVGAALIGARRG